jgi:hypothetical protein
MAGSKTSRPTWDAVDLDVGSAIHTSAGVAVQTELATTANGSALKRTPGD